LRTHAPRPPAAAGIDVTLITESEAAFLLQAKLGSLRAWSDFLTDCRRGRTDLHGHMLLPTCVMVIGRAKRPMYRTADVRDFIRAIHALGVGICRRRIEPMSAKLDIRHPDWRRRRIDETGRSIANYSTRIMGHAHGA